MRKRESRAGGPLLFFSVQRKNERKISLVPRLFMLKSLFCLRLPFRFIINAKRTGEENEWRAIR
jgi:hypothetical protein